MGGRDCNCLEMFPDGKGFSALCVASLNAA